MGRFFLFYGDQLDGGVASGLPPGFHSGFQLELASQRIGLTMEAMALVMWLKSMVLISSLTIANSLNIPQRPTDALKALNDNVALARAVLADTGMTVAREDLALEDAFWAQLPGNFPMRPRKAAITSRNFAAMAPFHNFPAGRASGNVTRQKLARPPDPSDRAESSSAGSICPKLARIATIAKGTNSTASAKTISAKVP